MNTYAIDLWGHESMAIGETASKARYQHYCSRDLGDLMTFEEYLKSIDSCRLIRKFRISDLFGDAEQFNDMKIARGIEFAYQGMRIEVDGKPGVIVGANYSQNLDVCLDGEYCTSNCHPFWRVKYFDRDGSVIAEYGD